MAKEVEKEGLARTVLDSFRLDDKVALVTGGGAGIGRGYARALGESGASVAVVDVAEARAKEVAEELTRKGIDAAAIRADVTVQADVDRMVEEVTKRWGSLTIAVNNAGIGMWHDAEEVLRTDWERIINLNLSAVFFCAQAEARVMSRVGYGKIINTASMSGHIVNTPQNQVAYNASKAGVIHLTRSLAAEWASCGIRVNSISPGYTRTDLVAKLLETPEGRGMLPKWLGMIPMGRMAEVEDLQGAVVYLASAASDYMTGHDLVVDGGYCVW